jgi:hypothetical protein
MRRGQRAVGRVWDAELNRIDAHALQVRFTPAVDSLWRGAVAVVGDQVARPVASSEAATRERLRKIAKGFAVEPAGALGDHLVFALFHRHLPGLELAEPASLRAASRLRAGSALARLFAPAEEGPGLSADLLRDPDLLRAVELLLPDIGQAWAAAAASCWSAPTREALTVRCRALRASMETWLAMIDARERLDLVEPVLAALVAAAEAPAEVRERLVHVGGVRTIADREEVARQLAATFDPDVVDRTLQPLTRARYGDERFAESRLVSPLVEARFGPRRVALASTLHRWRGQVG